MRAKSFSKEDVNTAIASGDRNQLRSYQERSATRLRRFIKLEALKELVEQDDVQTLRWLCENCININKYFGNTPLMQVVVHYGSLSMLRCALKLGGDPNARNRFCDQYLLSTACSRGIEFVRLLLKAGANPNVWNTHSYASPLMLAIDDEDIPLIRLLIRHGADVNKVTSMESPLTRASEPRTPDGLAIVELLLKKGALPEIKNSSYTALFIAARDNDIPLAKLLLKYGARPDFRMRAGDTALEVAEAEGHSEIVRLFEREIERNRLRALRSK